MPVWSLLVPLFSLRDDLPFTSLVPLIVLLFPYTNDLLHTLI